LFVLENQFAASIINDQQVKQVRTRNGFPITAYDVCASVC